MFSRNFVEEFKHILPSIQKWWRSVEHLMQTRQQWQQKAADIVEGITKLSKSEQRKLNNLAIEATLNNFWAYKDEEVFPTDEAWRNYVDRTMKANGAEYSLFLKKYDTMSASAKVSFGKLLGLGTEEKRRLAEIKIKDIHATLEPLIKSAATLEKRKELDRKYATDVARVRKDLEQALQHPYVPLSRQGKHVVTYRSAEYLKAEAELRKYKDHLASLDRQPNKVEEKTVKALRERLDDLAANEQHYVVEFYESKFDANKRYAALREQFPDAVPEAIQSFDKAIFLGEQAPKWASSRELLTQLTKMKGEKLGDAVITEKDIDTMTEVLQDLYIRKLPDVSARKAQLRRRGVAGYNDDVIENFTRHAQAASHLIASLENSQEVHDALEAISREVESKAATGNRDEASVLANEVRRRQKFIFSSKNSENVGKVMRATSVWMLLTNPAFYLQNILQPTIMSAPYINGALGINCISELTSAMKHVAQSISKDKTLRSLCDTLSKGEQEAVMRARDRQLLTIGISTDLGSASNATTYGRVTNWMTQKAQTVEVINRVSTHLVAYRNAIKKGYTHEAAMDFAEKVVVQTHGDYSKENAPSIMNRNDYTKAAFQFRKFQFIQTGLVYRVLRDSARKDLSPAERAIARRQLMWIMATHFAAAGLKGTPILAQIAALSTFVFGGAGDDDEDLIRQAIGDKDVSDLLLKGLPMIIGVDLSKKVGAGDMLNPLPFYEYDARKGKQNISELALNLAGPWASIPAKVAEGVTYMVNGQYSKGVESILPYGIATNLIKATRLQSEGYTNRAGDVLIKPESMNWVDWIYTGMGLTPKEMSRRTYLQGWAIRHDTAFKYAKADIQREYNEAKASRDYKGMAKAIKSLGELNQHRKNAGYTTIPRSQLDSTYKQKVKRENNAVGGVVSTAQNRAGLKRQSQW